MKEKVNKLRPRNRRTRLTNERRAPEAQAAPSAVRSCRYPEGEVTSMATSSAPSMCMSSRAVLRSPAKHACTNLLPA